MSNDSEPWRHMDPLCSTLPHTHPQGSYIRGEAMDNKNHLPKQRRETDAR